MSDYNAEQATQENQKHQESQQARMMGQEALATSPEIMESRVTDRTIDDMRGALSDLNGTLSRLIEINARIFGAEVSENQKVDNDIDGCFVDQRSRLSESIFDEIGDINSEISRLEGL